MKTTSGTYISRLDHLRFLAAFMVFHWHFALFNSLSHTDVPSFWPLSLLREGHTGVAFFMTISGYIFSKIAIGHTINYREFIRNRLFRIAPLFAVWVTLYFYIGKADPLKLIAAVFFFLNPNVVPANGWSVIIEFQCYLIFPFLILFADRHGVRYLAGLLMLLVLLKTGVWAQTGTVQGISYSTIFGRMDQFLCGMIAARLAERASAGALSKVFPWIALGFAAIALSYLYHRFNAMGGYFDGNAGGDSKRALWIVMPTLEGALYGALIIGYVALPIPIPKLIDKFFAKLGEVSYSLYLCHAFVLISTTRFLIDNLHVSIDTYAKEFVFGTFVVLPMCFAFSFVTYYLIEKPFLGFRRNYLERLPSELTPILNSSTAARTAAL